MYKLINLSKITDNRGNLTFIQNNLNIPFEIKRVALNYDKLNGQASRGYAHKNQHQLIIALTGSFDVVITDTQENKEVITLNQSNIGLYLPSITWRHMENFSNNSISLHLNNSVYNEKDFIINFEDFKNIKNESKYRF